MEELVPSSHNLEVSNPRHTFFLSGFLWTNRVPAQDAGNESHIPERNAGNESQAHMERSPPRPLVSLSG